MRHDCGPRERGGGLGRGPGGFGGRGTLHVRPGRPAPGAAGPHRSEAAPGDDLMRAIEEKFVGAYAPSPGAVYPTLTLLAEQDYLQSKKAGGGKKPYSITAEGVSYLAQH